VLILWQAATGKKGDVAAAGDRILRMRDGRIETAQGNPIQVAAR